MPRRLRDWSELPNNENPLLPQLLLGAFSPQHKMCGNLRAGRFTDF